MRTNDIIALAVLTTAGVAGYLLYTKQIAWPEDIIPNPFEDDNNKEDKKKDKDDDEEKDVKDNIKDSAGFDDKDLADFLADPFKSGKEIIGDLASSIIPKNKDFKKPTILTDYFKKPTTTKKQSSLPSLEELIADAFKTDDGKFPCGSPQRPYC